MTPHVSRPLTLLLGRVCLLALLAAPLALVLMPASAQAGSCQDADGNELAHAGATHTSGNTSHTQAPSDHATACQQAQAGGGLAVTIAGESGAKGAFDKFLETGFGGLLQGLLRVLSILVFIAFSAKQVWSLVTQQGQGGIKDFMQKMVPAVVVTLFIFNLSWFGSIIDFGVSVGGQAIEALGGLV